MGEPVPVEELARKMGSPRTGLGRCLPSARSIDNLVIKDWPDVRSNDR
jgi:hypothetical protein